MELNDARVEELDIETILNFALHTIGNPSGFWIEGDLDQKQRFQEVMFPYGLTFERCGIWNRCNMFSFQPLARHFERSIQFGVPYGSRTRVAAVKEKRFTVIQ
jgi:hypothetical protein